MYVSRKATSWKSCAWSLVVERLGRFAASIFKVINGVYLWKKRLRAEDSEIWAARLECVVDPSRLVVVSTPSAMHTVRLEVYCEEKREANTLVQRFGGDESEVREQSWHPSPATTPGRPLSIGGRLLVTGRPEELTALRATRPTVPSLCIPAAMAFGTGEHATTAMCLRLLTEVARQHAPGTWEMLDLGTGSGILALAAQKLGARHAYGVDHDPHAVRTARENARLNAVNTHAVRFAQADLMRWRLPEHPPWPVVTANLFSELLIRLLPDVIAPAVARRGSLILSGVLASQSDEVAGAVRAAGLTLVALKRRGRWRAFHCRRD